MLGGPPDVASDILSQIPEKCKDFFRKYGMFLVGFTDVLHGSAAYFPNRPSSSGRISLVFNKDCCLRHSTILA